MFREGLGHKYYIKISKVSTKYYTNILLLFILRDIASIVSTFKIGEQMNKINTTMFCDTCISLFQVSFVLYLL